MNNIDPKYLKQLVNTKLLILDFDGVLTNNKVHISDQGNEYVTCSRSDGIGIGNLLKHDILVYIVSTERNLVVTKRAEKLNVPCLQAVEDKGEAILELAKKLSISPKNITFIGNDINDISGLSVVGTAVGVQDCHNDINDYILLKTENNGGNGAVREICDLICKNLNSQVVI